MSVPQPSYILRGHLSQIHAVLFTHDNTRLLTADANGWVVIWDTSLCRPTASWPAHAEAVLGLAEWISSNGHRRIITHGRDNKILVWKLSPSDEPALSTALPADDSSVSGSQRKPWLVASLTVNALNFCALAVLPEKDVERDADGWQPQLVAVPSLLDSNSIDVFSLPCGERRHTRIAASSIKTGMAMSIVLSYTIPELVLAAGYESGHVLVFRHSAQQGWATVYTSKPHSQPVLSIALSPDADAPFVVSTSADALLVKHPLSGDAPLKIVDSRHAGQQGAAVRSDGKICATAGWDGKCRVYGCRGLKELAVLAWHKEGCYAVSFAGIKDEKEKGKDIVKKETVEEKRRRKVVEGHWLAVGSKDGKVSLWEMY